VTANLDGLQVGEASTVSNPLDMQYSAIGSASLLGWPGVPAGTDWWAFRGTIDEVAIYPYAISGSRAAAHYKAGTIGEFAGTKRVRIDYQDLSGSASLQVTQGRPGSSSDVAAGVLAPRYGLVTSSVDPDGKTTATEYQYPELGLATATVQDPTGLALRTEHTFEGASVANKAFRREKTRRLPALVGTSTTPTTYTYYYEHDARQPVYHRCGRVRPGRGHVQADLGGPRWCRRGDGHRGGVRVLRRWSSGGVAAWFGTLELLQL
jgi:hypothetical protein